MKKSILPIVAAITFFVSCGPSKEELAKRENEIKDSIQAINDQTKLQLEARMKAVQDSISEAATLETQRIQNNMQDQVNEVKNELAKKSEQAEKKANDTKKELEKMKQEEMKKEEEKKKKEDATVKPGQGRG